MKHILSYKECQSLRGVSILLIMLHNFAHNVTPFIENDKFFSIDKAQYYIDHFMDAPVLSFFGYFGWIGVAVFIFLTGYGLSLKYDSENIFYSHNKRKTFIFEHYKKLLLLMFIPYVIYLISQMSLKKVLYAIPDFLFVKDLLYYPNSPFFNFRVLEVYWYFGLCFELYVFYAIFGKYFKNKWFVFITLAISIASITLPPSPWIRYSKYNFLGFVPVFYAGYFASKIDMTHFRLSWRYLLAALLIPLYIFSSLNSTCWFISDVIGALCLVLLAPLFNNNIISYIGTISPYLFVLHYIIRQEWYIFGHDYMNVGRHFCLTSLVAYVMVCIVVAELYGRLLKFISRSLESRKTEK